MKKCCLMVLIFIVNSICFAKNPFITKRFSADPSAHVFEGRVYVYPSHDKDNPSGYNMSDYYIYSSDDLSNWTDHGKVLDVDDVPWAKEYMWAPDCAYKNGTYYFYFPAKGYDGKFYIGVATSSSPAGPFIPEEKPIPNSFSVDPAVFIDDDGTAYMYFGGDGDGGTKNAWVAKLKDNMKEFDGEPVKVDGPQYWFEACWMHKYNGTYYLSYSTGYHHPQYSTSALAYATASNPMGPFTYKGVFFDEVSGWTNHHSIVEYLGQWYLFYHTSDLSGGVTEKRCICVDYLKYNSDGTIKKVIATKEGVSPVDPVHTKMILNGPQPFSKRNLFYHQSAINYTLSQAGMVNVKILNSLGQEVASLVNRYQLPDKYSIPFSSHNLAGGSYFIRLSTNNRSETAPLMILP